MNRWVLRRRLHVSWLIALLGISIVIGVHSAQYVQPSLFASLVWVACGSFVSIVALWRRYMYLVPLIIIGGTIIGLWRGSVQHQELSYAQQLYYKTIVLTGTIQEDIDTDTSGNIVMRLGSLHVGNQAGPGQLWVSAKTDLDIKRSDVVTLEGKVLPGFGSFIGIIYQARITSVERPQPGDVARVVRDWFADKVRTAIPNPESSLGIGYLVGQKRALPADLVEALQIAGLTHVVVASGYNLTILVRLARRLFEKVSKYLATLSASLMIGGFIAVTGMSPSMSRAGLVAGLGLAAWYYGRRFHPIVLLSFVAAVTVMMNPSYAWGDVGWQLSFAAFAGVMILAPLLQVFFFGEKKPSLVRQILGETVAAVIATAPILIGTFGQFSNVAIIANLLVLPLVPLAMLLTFIAGMGAVLIPAWAMVIGWPASWLLGYMITVAEYFSGLSWSVTAIQLSPVGVVGCYVVLILCCFALVKVAKYDLRKSNLVE